QLAQEGDDGAGVGVGEVVEQPVGHDAVELAPARPLAVLEGGLDLGVGVVLEPGHVVGEVAAVDAAGGRVVGREVDHALDARQLHRVGGGAGRVEGGVTAAAVDDVLDEVAAALDQGRGPGVGRGGPRVGDGRAGVRGDVVALAAAAGSGQTDGD